MISVEISDEVIGLVQSALSEKELDMKGSLGSLANVCVADFDMDTITAVVNQINELHKVNEQIEVKKGMAGIA